MSHRLRRIVVPLLALLVIAGTVSGFAASNTVEPTRLGVEEVPVSVAP